MKLVTAVIQPFKLDDDGILVCDLQQTSVRAPVRPARSRFSQSGRLQ